MIERATMSEHYPVARPRTNVQRLQQKQWQALGMLYRTRANLVNIRSNCIIPIHVEKLADALEVIDTLIDWNLAAQRSLPSIKNNN